MSTNISYGQTYSRVLPDTWERKRLKFVVECNSISLGEETDPDYYFSYIDIGSVDLFRGIIKSELMNFENAPSRARRVIRKGDVIISTVRTYLKAIARIREDVKDTIVSTGFAVLTPNETINSDFLGYFAQSQIFVEKIMAFSNGVTYPSINSSDLVNMSIDVPAFLEQQTIAAFLDYKTEQIDKLIEKKEQLLKLLEEKRTALITQAVTKGLDTNVKMKPSGIDWFGDIPEHWEAKRLKQISSLFGRIGFRGYSTEDIVDEMEGAISLSPSNMNNGILNLKQCTFISWDKYIESPEIQISKDDILLVKTGSTIGKIAFVDEVTHPMTINPQLGVFKRIRCSNKYLFFYLISSVIQDQFQLSNTGSTIPTMTQATIGNFFIPVAPDEEQITIVSYLEIETKKINLLSHKIESAIDRLKEYRTSLITSAVTGKIDVRDFKPERV